MKRLPRAERKALQYYRDQDDDLAKVLNYFCENYPAFREYYYKTRNGSNHAFEYAEAILSYDQEIIARVPDNGPLVAALAARKRNAWILRILRTVFVISGLLIGAYICAAGQRLSSGAGLSDLSSKTQSVPMPSETQSTPMPPPSEAKADPPLVETEPPASPNPVGGGGDAGLAMMKEIIRFASSSQEKIDSSQARIESTNDRTQERIESISTNTIDKLVEVLRMGFEQSAR